MKFTTNVPKSNEQANTILNLIADQIGIGKVINPTMCKDLSMWIAGEAIIPNLNMNKRLFETSAGKVSLTRNASTGNIKLQFKKLETRPLMAVSAYVVVDNADTKSAVNVDDFEGDVLPLWKPGMSHLWNRNPEIR